MPRRGGERTRQRILDVALRLFAERGVDGTGLRAIADIVGVREPTLYHYFPSKDAIVDALVDEASRPGTTIDRTGEEHRDLETALVSVARAYFKDMARPRGKRLLRLLLVEGQHHPERARTYLSRVADPATRTLGDIFASRMRRGSRGTARLLALAFRCALTDFVVREELLRRGGKDSPDRASFARQLAALFARGIAAV